MRARAWRQPFPVSDHCDGRRFFNPRGTTGKSVWDVLRWIVREPSEPWPTHVALPTHPPPPVTIEPGAGAITFVNHCTLLLQWSGVRMLTDPVFSARVSPVPWAGPRRVMAPGLAIDALPPIDVILISHNHYDHVDSASLRRLLARHDPLVVTPLGNGRLLKRLGARRVEERDWWETVTTGGARITLTPAQHWSNRLGVPRNSALWSGFWIDVDGHAVYFAGDSAYGPHFAEVAARLGSPDVSLLPIGAYAPRWFMRDQHMDPAEAVQAHEELGSRLSIATHFGTFRLTNEGWDAPVRALARAKALRGLPAAGFRVLGQGETLSTLRAAATASS